MPGSETPKRRKRGDPLEATARHALSVVVAEHGPQATAAMLGLSPAGLARALGGLRILPTTRMTILDFLGDAALDVSQTEIEICRIVGVSLASYVKARTDQARGGRW